MRNKVNLAAIGLTVMLIFGACSLLGNNEQAFCTSVQTVQSEKAAIEVAVATLIAAHAVGKVPDAIYLQAQTAYSKWAAVQKTGVDGLVTWNDAGSSANYMTVMTAILTNLATLYIDFETVYSSVQGVPPMATLAQVSATATCSFTDDQLRSMYADPWSSLATRLHVN